MALHTEQLVDAPLSIENPNHRLTEAQMNFALELWNDARDEDGTHLAGVRLSHKIGEGAICEVTNDGNYAICRLTQMGGIDGEWLSL